MIEDDYTYNLLSGLPITMKGVYLHTVEPRTEFQEKLKSLLEALKLKKYTTLLLIGNTGVGKTYLSQALANTMIYNATNQERAACYTSHFEMELKLKNTMGNNYSGPSELEQITRYKAYNLLIIDEIGRGSTSEYFLNRLEYIVGDRMMKDKRTILITNKSPDELRNIFDVQMQDRLGIVKGGKPNPKTKRLMISGDSLRCDSL